LVIVNVCLALYPAIRLFSVEASMQGAEALASAHWLLARSLAMIGLILLKLGLPGLHGLLLETPSGSLCITALVVTLFGIGSTLPCYGAKTSALHAVEQEALRRNSVDLLVTLANSIRSEE
jgi:hypothetical protein